MACRSAMAALPLQTAGGSAACGCCHAPGSGRCGALAAGWPAGSLLWGCLPAALWSALPLRTCWLLLLGAGCCGTAASCSAAAGSVDTVARSAGTPARTRARSPAWHLAAVTLPVSASWPKVKADSLQLVAELSYQTPLAFGRAEDSQQGAHLSQQPAGWRCAGCVTELAAAPGQQPARQPRELPPRGPAGAAGRPLPGPPASAGAAAS